METARQLDIFEVGIKQRDNPLTKILAVQIDNKKRMSEADERFCIELQRHRDHALKGLHMILAHFECGFSGNSLFDPDSHIRKIKESVEETAKKFVRKVIGHFESTYKVSLSETPIFEKYGLETVTYNDVIDQIYEELEGASFQERAVQEIKANCKRFIGNYNRKRMIIKGNRLIFNNLVYYRYSWNGKLCLDYHCLKEMRVFFKAISHFDNLELDMYGTFNKYLSYDDYPESFWFKLHDLSHLEKIVGLRWFKNGRLDVTFIDHRTACEFASDYCGF